MKRLGYTGQFKRDFRKAVKAGKEKEKLDEVVLLLRKGIALDERYADHPLGGDWKGHRECHVEFDWLLIYKRLPDEIFLVRTGAHSELFSR